MKIRALGGSAIFCATALTLAAAALQWHPTAPSPPTPVKGAAVSAAIPVAAPAVRADESSAASDRQILSVRPLFAPGRARSAQETAAATDPEAPPPELQGIARAGARAIVLVRGGDGRPKRLGPGQEIAGWVVGRVQPDRVSFERSGQEVEVQLRRPQHPAATPPQAPARRRGEAVLGVVEDDPADEEFAEEEFDE